jgi:uncharacterized protein
VIKQKAGMIFLATLGLVLLQQVNASYPPRSTGISDLAGILPSRDQAALLESIAWFKRNTKAELLVLTVPSWKALGTFDKTWESFSTNLFNRWGIGSKSRNDGVLFIAAIQERKLRIELGLGFKRCYDPVMKQILEQKVVPLFKETRYGAGMVLGTKSIIQALPQVCPVKPVAVVTTPSVRQPVPSVQVTQPRSAPPAPFSPWLPIGGGLTLLGFWAALQGLRRPKRCPQCQSVLEQISEQQDDEFLNAGQQLEERLQSVNYQVWHCKTCNHHQLIQKKQWFSRYTQCPACQHQTLDGQRVVVVLASHSHQGLERLNRHCSHCGHQDSQDIILPPISRDQNRSTFHHVNAPSVDTSSRITSSASSTQADSGGGQSNGGGASADW